MTEWSELLCIPGRNQAASAPHRNSLTRRRSARSKRRCLALEQSNTRLGPKSTVWAEAMIQARGVEGVRVLVGLLSLTSRHPTSTIEQACEIALGYGEYHLRTIRAP